MNLFKEIHAGLAQQSPTDKLIENVSSLTPNEIGRLVSYVRDEQKNGNKDDTGELVGQALENIPGMEGASEKEVSDVISTVARAVKLKNEFVARQQAKQAK